MSYHGEATRLSSSSAQKRTQVWMKMGRGARLRWAYSERKITTGPSEDVIDRKIGPASVADASRWVHLRPEQASIIDGDGNGEAQYDPRLGSPPIRRNTQCSNRIPPSTSAAVAQMRHLSKKRKAEGFFFLLVLLVLLLVVVLFPSSSSSLLTSPAPTSNSLLRAPASMHSCPTPSCSPRPPQVAHGDVVIHETVSIPSHPFPRTRNDTVRIWGMVYKLRLERYGEEAERKERREGVVEGAQIRAQYEEMP
ncbi:hypothetical protein R3P38DRAFT_3177747 [Favolaschia claudopus]|uniref:Uncharacterized protein n=1 Tax=Favolaschia claudopus TaxID=2862362 RepID=A0AAW0CW93_9AGAR